MRALTLAILFAPLLAGLAADEPPPKQADGVVSGGVRFTGDVPKAKLIPTTDGGMIEHRDLVVDGKTKGLRSVLVHLEDAPAQPRLEKAEAALMDQRDMLFLPRVLAVQDGRPVRFENNDLCNHSVHAASTVKANQLNVIAGPGQPITHTFEVQKPPVLIGCALHGWMRGWVYVLPHPWFAVTDDQGGFRIPKAPVGKYKLTFIHADTNLRETRMVEVKAGEETKVQVEWDKLPK